MPTGMSSVSGRPKTSLGVFGLLVDLGQVVVRLQLQPAFWRAPKGFGQADGHLQRDVGMVGEQQG